jgi:hypothetical protein
VRVATVQHDAKVAREQLLREVGPDAVLAPAMSAYDSAPSGSGGGRRFRYRGGEVAVLWSGRIGGQ